MGNKESKTETQYNYVDHSRDREEEARRREQARLENERRQREIREKQRIEQEAREAAERKRQAFLAKLEREKRAEEEARQREERRLEQERQNQLELEAKSAKQRQDLFDYEFGSKIHLASFRDLNIDDVNKLRIGVFGPTGSGKSCFISTCERVVRREDKGSCPIATGGAEGTLVLEDFLPEMFFRLVDTRGFFNYDANEGGEFSDILFGRLKPGDCIKREKDEPSTNRDTTDAPFSDWIHGIILVVKANDPRLSQGALSDYLNPVREILRPLGISPVTVVTHRDTLKDDECEAALDLASAATGSSRRQTFFVANYCPANPGPDVNTELQIFEILHFALLTAERYVKIAKQQKKNKEEDEMQRALDRGNIGSPSTINKKASIEMFLNLLQCTYKWKDSDILKVLEQLKEEDITNMGMLAENWQDVKQIFPIGMKNSIERKLRNSNMI